MSDKEKIAELKELLKKLEFCADYNEYGDHIKKCLCPICEEMASHLPDCRLKKALEE